MSNQHHGKLDGSGPTEHPTAKTIGDRIATARRRVGLTQRELSVKLAVSSGAVGQWETGGSPSAERLVPLAQVLNVSVDWLLGRSERTGMQTEPTEDQRLLKEARDLGIDLRAVVQEARQKRWTEENRGALDDANAFLERHGLWSDGKRQF